MLRCMCNILLLAILDKRGISMGLETYIRMGLLHPDTHPNFLWQSDTGGKFA